ncbi:MAG: PilZ domain-containing protein [Nitrospira sp.]
MTNRKNPIRRHSRFPVSWSVLYGSDEFLAEGTVLDLTSRGWRIAGSMPVTPGMQLTLQVSVPEKSTPLRVQRATVLWVTDHDFAIEAHEMPPNDHAWVAEFLRQKLGLMWISREDDHGISCHATEKVLRSETQPSVPRIEDVLQRFLAIQPPVIDIPSEARWQCDSDVQENEGHTASEGLPEKIWHEVHRILRSMLAIRAARERTGRDLIADN